MAQHEPAKEQKATSDCRQTLERAGDPRGSYHSAPITASGRPPTLPSTPASALSHTTTQRSLANPRTLAPTDILQLQRAVGNQVVQRMLNPLMEPKPLPASRLQRKRSAARDEGEQEADGVATQVTQPQGLRTVQRVHATALPSIQRKGQSKGKKEKISFNGQTKSVNKNDKDAVNHSITKMAVKGKKSVKTNEQLESVVFMGTPGAHLDPIVNNVVANASNFVRADRYRVRQALAPQPAGSDGSVTKAVDDQSKEITKSIMAKSVSKRRNLIYVGMSDDYAEYEAILTDLKEAGYRTTLVMSHVQIDEGLKRLAEHAAATGRKIPLNGAKDLHKWVPESFVKLVSMESIIAGSMDMGQLVNEAYLFDTTMTNGEMPRVVWHKGDGLSVPFTDTLENILDAIGAKKADPAKTATQQTSNDPTQEDGHLQSNYLQPGGTGRWKKASGAGRSKKLNHITNSIKLFNQAKAKNLGNAEMQGHLLLGLQKALTNFSDDQPAPTKPKTTSKQLPLAITTLRGEVKRELGANPIRLQKVSDAEKMKELVRVGFVKEFFSHIPRSDLQLLYEAHTALSHQRLALAQVALDRLNPIERNDKGAFKEYKGHIVRTRDNLYFAQQMLTAHHHKTIGGDYASVFTQDSLDKTSVEEITNKHIFNKNFMGPGAFDAEKAKGAGHKSLDELISDHPELTPEEISAIRYYTNNNFVSINGAMHDIRIANPEEKKGFKGYMALNQVALSGLNKLPSYTGKQVYRGDSNFGGIANTARPGTTFLTPSFVSTAKESKAFGSNLAWVIRVAPNSRGKDIEHLSTAGDREKEVLFPPGTKLKIVDVYRRDEGRVVKSGESLQERAQRTWHSDTGQKIPDDLLDFFVMGHGNRTILIAQEL